MYRGFSPARNVPLRAKEPVCSDFVGYTPDDSCERDSYEGDFNRYPIGMCYVPWQKFRNLFENEFVALDKGTLFKELHLEWYGRSCK
ncbi:MAG: spore coat associated protein CotJA [Clostridiales bacterium]|nr:spore coat associated protein CotJA [Clostridiales bacterium]